MRNFLDKYGMSTLAKVALIIAGILCIFAAVMIGINIAKFLGTIAGIVIGILFGVVAVGMLIKITIGLKDVINS